MNYIVTKPTKSKGIAALLVMLFGGIGLFYASVTGGIIMGIVAPFAIFFFFFLGIMTSTMSLVALVIVFCCLYYIICLIWALNAVNIYNQRLISDSYLYNNTSVQVTTDLNTYPTDQNEQKKRSTLWIWILSILLLITAVYILYYKGVFSNESVGKTGITNTQSNDSVTQKLSSSIAKKKIDDNRIDRNILKDPSATAWKIENEERYLIFSNKKIYMILNGNLVKTWHEVKSYLDDEYEVTETKEGDEFLVFGGIQIIYKSGKRAEYQGDDIPLKDVRIKEKYFK